MKFQWFYAVPAIAAATLSIISCGGGGSGSDFEGAAIVSLDVSPQNIDSGDRMTVSAHVGEVNANGILLKFRYPSELSYVKSSAFLTIHGHQVDLSPDYNVTESPPSGTAAASPTASGTATSTTTTSSTPSTYLVFFLSQSLFTHPDDEKYKGDFGDISLQLEGLGKVIDDLVEVDADIDDPTVEREDEFVVSNPEFSPQDEKSISVTN